MKYNLSKLIDTYNWKVWGRLLSKKPIRRLIQGYKNSNIKLSKVSFSYKKNKRKYRIIKYDLNSIFNIVRVFEKTKNNTNIFRNYYQTWLKLNNKIQINNNSKYFYKNFKKFFYQKKQIFY